MVSKKEESPDDSKKSELNVCTDKEKDIITGKSYLLQVPVKKVPSEGNLNASIDSPQAVMNIDANNILQEVSEDEIAGNENKVDATKKIESTDNENTHLPDMKIKVENKKTTHVLETVQFESFSPETEAETNSKTEVISKSPLVVGEPDRSRTVSPKENDTSETKSTASTETTPEKKVELVPETENKGIFPPPARPHIEEESRNKKGEVPAGTHTEDSADKKSEVEGLKSSQETKEEKIVQTSDKLKKPSQKAKIKKKTGFAGNMKDLTRDLMGIKEGEKLSDKLKEFMEEVKTPEGAKKKFADIMRSLKDEEIRVLPPYNPETCGPLLEYEIPAGFTELERYWVEEPYAFISIIENREMKYYYVVEPTLTTYEKAVLERVRNNLEDVLTQEDMIAGKEKDVILINRAMRLLDQYYSTLEVSSIHKIVYFLRRNFIGYERINPLIHDPNIEDISCSGIEIPIYLYHRKHNNIVTNIHFGEKELDSLVVKLCQRSGKHISIGEPIVDATLPDGSRIQATLGKEVTTRGSSYTIRKFKGDPITPVDLMRYGTCSIEMMAYYWIAIENNISVLFAGGTASGKTSLMNAISLLFRGCQR